MIMKKKITRMREELASMDLSIGGINTHLFLSNTVLFYQKSFSSF